MNSKNPDAVPERFLLALEQLTSLLCSLSDNTDPPKSGREQLGKNLLIALSGGLDSVVLLNLACAWQQQKGGTVRAVYIDHQLQSQSSAWGEHCASLCGALGVSFSIEKVTVDLESGSSPEAAARDARYHALEKLIERDEFLCTAHHADDQAETLLLQLFRGAGVQGLAAMPEYRKFGPGYLVRPLLHMSRDDLTLYAEANRLVWCEDPSNTDRRYDRNFMRHDLIPAVTDRWPGASGNLSRSASHCRDAVSLLNDLAQMDVAGSGSSDHSMAEVGSELSVARLHLLSSVRCKNALRYWVSSNGFQAPSYAQLTQIIKDLVHADSDTHGRVSFGQAQIARHRQSLFIGARGQFDAAPEFEYLWADITRPLSIPEAGWTLVSINRPRLQKYHGQPLIVRNRRGGEKWRPEKTGHSVSVKSLLQQKQIPPWQRSRLALVFCAEELIDICGPAFEL